MGASGLTLHRVTPNPFNPSTEIRFEVPDERPVKLSIHDGSGRLIRSLLDGIAMSGANVVHWEGLNNAGVPVTSGLYLVRLEHDGQVETQKAVLLAVTRGSPSVLQLASMRLHSAGVDLTPWVGNRAYQPPSSFFAGSLEVPGMDCSE